MTSSSTPAPSPSSAPAVTPPATVAFLGLGVMGGPMAAHLACAGFEVRAFNRTGSRGDAWLQALRETHPQVRAELCTLPAEAAQGADAVLLCVGADADVLSVLEGSEGALATLASGALVIDHTTASPTLARQLAERCESRGVGFLDAPVSGGQAGAEQGALTIMVGGAKNSFVRAQSVLDCYGKRVRHLGPAGSGQLAKIVNQVCIAGLLQGLAEGIHFAEQAGLDVDAVIEVISAGAAQSWQLDNRARTMTRREFDFGFAVDWMRKDLGLALAEADHLGARLPVAALVQQFYGDVQAEGGGRWDTSSLIQRFSRGTKSRLA
ncbi:MAG: NAD(P)-dependent oxidoreductase [Pseudomonadota bacterium]